MPPFHGKYKKLFRGNPPDVLHKPVNERPRNWREDLLRSLDPLSAEAFYVRNERFSEYEIACREDDCEVIARDIQGFADDPLAEPVESRPQSSPLSALAEFSFDIDAECAVVCAGLDRPHELADAGLRPVHFFDPALAELFTVCDNLHVKEGVARPFSRIPDALGARSWWRLNWEKEGRRLFLMILNEHWQADAKEAAATIISLAKGRGVA